MFTTQDSDNVVVGRGLGGRLRAGCCAVAALCALGPLSPALADAPATSTGPGDPVEAKEEVSEPLRVKGEEEFPIPPGGGAVEVPVHALAVCVLSFPERMASLGLASSADFEIKMWGVDSVAVRAERNATTATLALATASGQIKVNVTFRVVPESTSALTLVRFKPVSAEAAIAARIKVELAKRIAPLQAELTALHRTFEDRLRERTESELMARALRRSDTLRIAAHERSDAHVVVHVTKALLLGDDVYLLFEIENRSNAPFRLAGVQVRTPDGATISGAAQLRGAAPDRSAALVGVVPRRTTSQGVVVLRAFDVLRGKRLTLELAELDPRRSIELRDISLQ